MTAIRAIIAVLVAVGTAANVYGVKQAIHSGLSYLDKSELYTLGAVVLIPLYSWGAWTYLLRPMLQRRQERHGAGLRQRTVRDAARDR